MPRLLSAEPSPIGPIDFGGGLNLSVPGTMIADNEAVEICNCEPGALSGAMSKRNGSKRFINQAYSSNPITSMQFVYASSGSLNFSGLIAGTRDRLIYSSQPFSASPFWTTIATGLTHNQNYNFVQMGNKVLIVGDSLRDNVKAYDLITSSMSNAFLRDDVVLSTGGGIVPRGKYQLVANNYYLLGNVIESKNSDPLQGPTTYYPYRTYFSRLNNFSSMTAQRFIDFKTNEEVTGLGSIFDGNVNVFYPTSIGEISFTILDLPSQGGDFQTQTIVSGFGCIAPKTLVTTGQQNGLYVFLSKDGVRMWDGGRQSRLNVGDSSRIISGKVKPLIDDLIKSGNYQNATGFYYPKKEWYILSFELNTRYPKGKNNYVLVYDFRTDTWWPFCNWMMDSFAYAGNRNDPGQLFGGYSVDGFVDLIDVETRPDDSRKELVFDTMDSTFSWRGSTQNVTQVIEGTASLKMSVGYTGTAGTVITSTITRMGSIQFGEWHDKTKVNLEDKFSFKAYGWNVSSITAFRVDFEVNNIEDEFDTNFTSVTFSSNVFSGGDKWVTIEVPISSFPIRGDWTDLSIESVPFANPFNIYGVRLVQTGVYFSSVSIDDMRIVQATDNPNKMSRTTKLFDFRSPAFKGFGTTLITREKAPDASFSMDIYNDFGQKLRTETFAPGTPKELVLFRYNNTPGIAVLDSVSYVVKRQTSTSLAHWNCLNGVANEKTIVCGDRTNNRLLSFARNDFSTFTMVYGSFGGGTSNFNLIHEIAETKSGYLIADLKNQRIKLHSLKNLGFIRMYGQLGSGATSYHQNTGVTGDETDFFVSVEANERLDKVDQSTFGIKLQVSVDHNTNADTSLASDDRNVYMAYNKVSPTDSDGQDVWVDVRDKGDLSLQNRFRILPANVSTGSYQTMGSMSMWGRYFLVPFANVNDTGNDMFYFQKRLKRTGEIVSEYVTDQRFLSVIGYSPSYLPLTKTETKDLKVSGRYIQLKFYDKDLDNYWRVFNITPLSNIQSLTY